MVSPNPSLTISRRVLDFTDLKSFIDSHVSDTVAKHRIKRVKATTLPEIPADTITGTNPNAPIGPECVVNVSALYPPILVEHMPAKTYTQYMGTLARVSMAELEVQNRVLAETLKTGMGRTLVALATAVRCGIWASLNRVPASTDMLHSQVLKYRLKDGRLYRMAMADCKEKAAWYYAYDATEPISDRTEELMHRVAHIAPVFLDMECAEMTRQALSYASPYVERGISGYLRSKLSAEAYAIANFDKPLVWSLLRQSAVLGQPVDMVRSWATDTVFHIQAHRRILSTREEVAASKRREDAYKSRSNSVIIQVPDDADSVIDDDFAAAVRSARPRVMSADMESVAAWSAWGDVGAGSRSPVASAPASPIAETAVPSRVHTPPPPMTIEQANDIRAAVADAAASGRRAVSEMMGAQDDQTVAW